MNHVSFLFIHPEYQNKGYGSKLIIDFIRLSGKKIIDLGSTRNTTKFYEKWGFHKIADYDNKNYRCFTFTKDKRKMARLKRKHYTYHSDPIACDLPFTKRELWDNRPKNHAEVLREFLGYQKEENSLEENYQLLLFDLPTVPSPYRTEKFAQLFGDEFYIPWMLKKLRGE